VSNPLALGKMPATTPPNPYLNVYLGHTLKSQWAAYCDRLGKKPGAALKEAIEAQIAKGQGSAPALPSAPAKKQKTESPDDGVRVRLELRLTPSERAAVETFAQAGECSAQQWVITALRGVLTKTPQFSMSEWKALGESNYLLLAIGRNLNQIARRYNEQAKSRKPEPIDEKHLGEVIETLRKEIKQHVTKASAALRANSERWILE